GLRSVRGLYQQDAIYRHCCASELFKYPWEEVLERMTTHPICNRDTNDIQTMASPDHKQPRAIIRHGNLFTPEEPLLDSFTKGSGDTSGVPQLAPFQTLSPPISPEAKTLPSFQYPAHDATLYPEHHPTEDSDPGSPLFSSASSNATQSSTTQAHPPATFEERAERLGITNLGRFLGPSYYLEPTRKAALGFYSNSMSELEDLQQLRHDSQLPPPNKSHALPRDPTSSRQIASLGKFTAGYKPAGIVKSKPVPKASASPKTTPKVKVSQETPPKASATAPRKRTPRAQTAEEFHDRAFPQQQQHHQQQPKHKRAAPTKKVEGKDDDSTWRELPNYCPPIETLNDAAKPLKVQWKSNPLDIHEEPDRELLHPAEYDAASELRLRPQQYLANKRRMFMARVKYMRERKNFTKTAAQNATNIDVNKTSRLWEAFDRVGWFEDSLFRQYMDGTDETSASPDRMEE
ncbi:hypothetical protein D0864_16684, partial [Hortaea werneckii]